MATQTDHAAGAPDDGALGRPAVRLDDRAAGDDAVVLVPALQSCCNPIRDGFVGFGNYALFLTDPAFFAGDLQHADARRLRCC